MALQANWPELDFTALDNKKEMYISAIQAGLECNYEPPAIQSKDYLY